MLASGTNMHSQMRSVVESWMVVMRSSVAPVEGHMPLPLCEGRSVSSTELMSSSLPAISASASTTSSGVRSSRTAIRACCLSGSHVKGSHEEVCCHR